MSAAPEPVPGLWSPLSVLCRAPAPWLKAQAQALLDRLSPGDVEVTDNATGLVTLPMQDSVRGGPFLLGEVLVARASVRVCGTPGFAAVLGRDLEQALAAALLDAATRLPDHAAPLQVLVTEQRQAQERADETMLREVEATRVEMETY